ncbi:MAG: hypothetical protein ACM3QU_04700 [Verrucomicrobiota bacterium]
MRVKHLVLLAALVSILAGLTFVGTAATIPPGNAYHWAQPGCAPVSTPDAQPPSWIPASSPVVPATVPGSSYAWGQPGCAPVVTPGAQPPAGTPTG